MRFSESKLYVCKRNILRKTASIELKKTEDAQKFHKGFRENHRQPIQLLLMFIC